MNSFFPTPDDFGRHIIFGNIPIVTLAGQRIQLSLVDLLADGVVEWHSHENEQMGYIVSGRAKFQIADQEKVLHAGEMYRIPGGVRHRVTTLGAPARVLDVFYPVREEYR
jgi:quercetin dioxygenase-like cupin family protein